MTPSDEELMAAYADEDMGAFELLYERHKGRILGYLFARLKDRDAAEEVFQSVFTKLHLARRRYRRDIPFLPWVYAIVHNALVDYVRRDRTYRRHIEVTDEIVAIAPANGRDVPIAGAVPEIASLSPSQRRALELRFDQGFTFDEIAAALKTTAANSRQLISRAVRHLRRAMNDKGAK